MYDPKPDMQEWIKQRADEVRRRYTAYECLTEFGHGEQLSDETMATQLFCPVHHNVNTMAARYYPAEGGRPDRVHCFGSCKESWDCLGLYMRFKNLRFMDALTELERRLGVRVPRRPEPPPIAVPVERRSGYVSERWGDVPAVLELMERKLVRVRDRCAMTDYVKLCRLIDAIQWDFDRSHRATEDMVQALARGMAMMDGMVAAPDLG